MNCPPTKRLRGLKNEVVPTVVFDDPFGDDEDFTQDDLDEIDVIASQAVTSAAAGAGLPPKPASKSFEPATGSAWLPSAGHNKPPSRASINQIRESTFGFSSNRGNGEKSSGEHLGKFTAYTSFFLYCLVFKGWYSF